MTTKTWNVQLTIDEDEDDTYVDAVLSLDSLLDLEPRVDRHEVVTQLVVRGVER